ncbi:glycosyltransferase family 2 protein [Nonomuraea sp. NPDC050310]|uniref:glycosyltransferase family 2 protein n=1 Tax=unclassified Nonomuraea TaxID=2593643 RepID=UPI0033DDF767
MARLRPRRRRGTGRNVRTMSPEHTKINGKIQVAPLRSMPPLERFTPITPHLAIAPTVSVVVPAMNEAQNLPHVFATLPQWIDEIVLVDGNSVDDTVEVARRLRPNVKIVTQTGRGKGDALAAGFNAATGDIIVMIDADGSTDGHEIITFVGALVTGADFVKGSRYASGGNSDDLTFSRRFGNLILTKLVNLFYGTQYTDLCYGYNAFWSRHLSVLDLDCDGFEVETLMNVRAAKAGLKVVEVPSHERCRIHGESNLRAIRDGMRVLRTILREKRRQPAAPLPEPATTRAADRGVA